MDYNARFYDPMLSRFTSPDSIIPEPGSVIGYNRYAYVNNNPVRYSDPNGHSIALDDTNDGTLVRYNKYGNAKVITYGNNVKQKFLDSLHYLPSAPGIDYVEPNLLGTWAENGYDSHSYGARTYVISPDSNTDVPASGTDGASVAVGAINLAADAAVMGQQSWIMNNRNDIFVYINVFSMSNGRIAYNSLTIRNTTNMTLSVDNVMFEVRGDGYHCEKVCTPNNYNYIINENPVYTMDDKITRGYVLPNQTAVIPLTSSVKDSFYKDTSVSIWVLLREVRLDDKYPPIYKKLQ